MKSKKTTVTIRLPPAQLELYEIVKRYIALDPSTISEEERWHIRQQIDLRIFRDREGLRKIIDTLFFSPRNKLMEIDANIFQIWGYIAGMANLPEEMDLLFRALCKLSDFDGRIILHTFHDAYHYEVIDTLLQNYQFT